MTPAPLSTSALPASNCGLINATILPKGRNKATAGGRILCSEMNEQSITARSARVNGGGKPAGVRVRGRWFFP